MAVGRSILALSIGLVAGLFFEALQLAFFLASIGSDRGIPLYVYLAPMFTGFAVGSLVTWLISKRWLTAAMAGTVLVGVSLFAFFALV